MVSLLFYFIIYYLNHNFKDPSIIQSMKESKNPDAVRGWLDTRVAEGFDASSIKALLRMSSEELVEVCYLFSLVSFHPTLKNLLF